MFVAIYRYHVPSDKTKEYIVLQRKALEIYIEHGCLGVEIYRNDKDPKQWMEINRYEDRTHYGEVIAAVNSDSRIKSLFEEFIGLIDSEETTERSTYYRMI
jgi:quinol monooxygenase YgiN